MRSTRTWARAGITSSEESVLTRPPPLNQILNRLLSRLRSRPRSRKMDGPKKPKPKSEAATKPAAGKTNKKPAASVKTAAGKPTTHELVVPNQTSTSPLEDNSDLLDHLHIQACVDLTRRLLTSISSLPTGAARPRSVLKNVILFVAEYGSTP